MTNDPNRLRYEKSLEIRYREADLLFQRFNFFMVGMSFLVAAFAAIVASNAADELRGVSLAIAAFGVFLSIVFFFTNYLAGRTISRFDDEYLNIVEGRMPLDDGPFARIRQCSLADPCPYESRERCCVIRPFVKGYSKVCRCLWRSYGRFDHCSRAPHTWLVPLFFLVFWAVMIGLT